MGIINTLRPVEALYLLAHAKKELMSEENSLAATLVYLANEGYIQPVNKEFRLTKKGKKKEKN